MAVRFENRHPQSETRFSPQKTRNFASVIELKIAAPDGFRLGMPRLLRCLQNIIPACGCLRMNFGLRPTPSTKAICPRVSGQYSAAARRLPPVAPDHPRMILCRRERRIHRREFSRFLRSAVPYMISCSFSSPLRGIIGVSASTPASSAICRNSFFARV